MTSIQLPLFPCIYEPDQRQHPCQNVPAAGNFAAFIGARKKALSDA